jgi:secondary thiamine-phosphate synthase enzyme
MDSSERRLPPCGIVVVSYRCASHSYQKEVFVNWVQHSLRLPPFSRGFHLITNRVAEAIPELARCRVGLLHVYIQHTSASLTINENADPDVAVDLESAFNALAPEDFPYVHTMEGPDDMPAHVKAAMLGSSVSAPVSDGKLLLGTWQGIYLCEHRNRASARQLVLTLQGEME